MPGDLITSLLSQARTEEVEHLAIEGYRFYAKESCEFAEASADAVAEAIHVAKKRCDTLMATVIIEPKV